jgi:ribonuclease P protein component
MVRFTKEEIATTFKAARRVLKHPGLDILKAPTQGVGKLLVVTPRHTGNAVHRNRIRRRLKAIFYEEKLGNRGYNCIVIVKKESNTLSFDDLKALLIQAFSHATP